MATLSAIRDAVQSQLSTVAGLKRYDVATGRERLPAATVFPSSIQQVSNCDTFTIDFVIEIHVGLGQGLPRAQDELDKYVDRTGASSVMVALESDKTLGSVVDTLHVGDGQSIFRGYSFGELNGEATLTARVPFTVRAT